MIGSRRALLRSTRPFLLRDSFGKPAAAGSFHQTTTPAVPGPGMRTGYDTTNLMQVAPWKGSASLADETTMSATFGAANNRCSYADGQAWVGFAGADFGNAGLTADRWYLLVMQDSSSKLAYCYVKGGDVGAGEALGSELITNGNFSSDVGWTAQTGWSIAGGVAIATTTGNTLYRGISGTVKKLYKLQLDVINVSVGSVEFAFNGTRNGTFNTTGTKTAYAIFTGQSGNAGIAGAISLTGEFDNVSLQEVTTPSAQCLYAYKTPNGSQGWHMDGSFNMNASAYTYDIYELGETALVCAGGKSTGSAGDPYLGYSAIARRLGLTLIAGPINIADVTGIVEIGFDESNQTGALTANCFRITADTIKPYNAGVAGPTIGVPADATNYYFAVRLLATAGAHYYIKGGTWTTWKLVWVSNT